MTVNSMKAQNRSQSFLIKNVGEKIESKALSMENILKNVLLLEKRENGAWVLLHCYSCECLFESHINIMKGE